MKQDTDLNGADLPNGGVENIVSPEACCAACVARQDCGAWTFAALAEVCYLKAAKGWQEKPVDGLQSAVMSNRNTTVVVVDPNPPTSPPPPSPTPSPPTTPGAPPSPSPGDPYAPGPYQFVDMTEDQKRRMYELTSIFENSDVRDWGWMGGWWVGVGQAVGAFGAAALHLQVVRSLPPDAPFACAPPMCPCRPTCSTTTLNGWGMTAVSAGTT